MSKKGSKRLVIGILTTIIGICVVPIISVGVVFGNLPEAKQFTIPGSFEYTIEEPGRYYLWNDFQTVYKGKTYSQSSAIPNGLSIEIKDSNGEVLTFHSYTMMNSQMGSSAKNTIGYIDTEIPQTVYVSVTGDIEPRVFSFSQGIFGVISNFFIAIAATAIVTLSGIGLIIWACVAKANSKKIPPELPQA